MGETYLVIVRVLSRLGDAARVLAVVDLEGGLFSFLDFTSAQDCWGGVCLVGGA